jgi:hypothetical protein
MKFLMMSFTIYIYIYIKKNYFRKISKLKYTDDENLSEEVLEDSIPCPVCRRDIKLCQDCEHANFDCICK